MSVCPIHGVASDTGYFNVCHVCGIPSDVGYFDVADIHPAPQPGKAVDLVRYQLHPQYCGVLLYFAQYAEPVQNDPVAAQQKQIFKTPGYEWLILCNNQPRAPYSPTSVIRNPWGQNAFPIHLKLDEGCLLSFVVRKVTGASGEIPLSRVGGRLHGRHWYNTIYGGAPNRL